MSTGEWILIVIGAVQAIALAVAAIFAWKTYGLARDQRLEALDELETGMPPTRYAGAC
jgi:hypothetical protein